MSFFLVVPPPSVPGAHLDDTAGYQEGEDNYAETLRALPCLDHAIEAREAERVERDDDENEDPCIYDD
ncbi:hypothetical protein Taro_008172 [Colocasia esculenta]|uniref:Uncharacterized protein n=1 Tax=Colocasia esculenta TaxID=4460 RepID=A0A843U0C4_COLES|nr:hypothetical protein [Colocasia esculenta]